MPTSTKACARCTMLNHAANRFCDGCGLPLGAAEADAGAWIDVFGPYEHAEPAEVNLSRQIRDFAARSGFDSKPIGANWRVDVLLPMGRKQAVYLGAAGSDLDGRAIVALVSICGTANDRDPRILLRLNARIVEGHFAIKILRGEEYFVVIRNIPVGTLDQTDAQQVVARIATTADDLEDRLSRGRDLF